MDEKSKQKIKRQNVRDGYFENCMDINETKISNYNLLSRVNK